MSGLIEQIEKSVSTSYFLAQFLTIICLFVYGFYFLTIFSENKSEEEKVLTPVLAYPMGLAVFSLTAFFMVIVGIPYNACSVIICCILAGVIAYAARCLITGRKALSQKLKDIISGYSIKYLIIIALIAASLAAVSCLGIFSVTVSNDTMYRYSFYPRAIVHFGELRVNYDTFLTDVGQGYVLINTLPFLFNFNESFGIQHMLNICFIILFFKAVYEQFKDLGRKWALIFAGTVSLLLVGSLPFEIISKWILSNDFFAVFLFITAYIAVKQVKEKSYSLAVLGIFFAALSTMRIEGGVYAALLILCISTLDFAGKDLGIYIFSPVIILQAIYCIRIFFTMKITAPYSFLTTEKAVIMMAIMILTLLYLLLIRGRFLNKLFDKMGILIIAATVGVNLLLFVKGPSLFIENLKCFVSNILFVGGWGVIPIVIVSLYLICVFSGIKFGYWDLIAFSYLFYSIAVSFMRDGGLKAGVGDSGNRVLMLAVPLLLFAASGHLPDVLNKTKSIADNNDKDYNNKNEMKGDLK